MSAKIFSQLTPVGRGAVATTWVNSPNLADKLGNHFRTVSGKPIKLVLNRPAFGYWVRGEASGEGLVVCLLDSTTAEIHSHGGTVAPEMIAKTLTDDGFHEVSHEEIAERQFSRWEGEVQLALCNAPTEKSAIELLRLGGRIRNCLDRLKQMIQEKSSGAAQTEIQRALSCASYGLHLTQPWKVVICGPPNVGKSSLINAIAGFARAIVNDSPGTTRDIVSQTTALDGWPVEMTDTAGIRDTSHLIETHGIERAMDVVKSADLRIAMFDGSQRYSETERQLLKTVDAEIVIFNKSDVSIDDPNRPAGMLVSATQGTGIPHVIQSVVSHLIPESSSLHDWFPINIRQENQLKESLELVSHERFDEAQNCLG